MKQTQTTNQIKADVEQAVGNLLNALRIDWKDDHNANKTPQRVAKMFVDEVLLSTLPKAKINVDGNFSAVYNNVCVLREAFDNIDKSLFILDKRFIYKKIEEEHGDLSSFFQE